MQHRWLMVWDRLRRHGNRHPGGRNAGAAPAILGIGGRRDGDV